VIETAVGEGGIGAADRVVEGSYRALAGAGQDADRLEAARCCRENVTARVAKVQEDRLVRGGALAVLAVRSGGKWASRSLLS
jgi:hypothetical protein